MSRPAIVITSINSADLPAFQAFSAGATAHGWDLIVVGDIASPPHFRLAGAHFHSLADQLASGAPLAKLVPEKHYARKNLGYLYAMQSRAAYIIDTDDDNIPCAGFWQLRLPHVRGRNFDVASWVNVYKYFTEAQIWPRGFPLERLKDSQPARISLAQVDCYCPILQALADGNPDVDAIYRLTADLPQNFRQDSPVILTNGALCPFNSQNTTFFPDAYPLLYLPSYCSFRVTDIWRSLVACFICHDNKWGIGFTAATVYQERNQHDLLRDFEDEVPGYLLNTRIADTLAALDLTPGREAICDNLLAAYEQLVRKAYIDRREMAVLEAWVRAVTTTRGDHG